MSGSTRRSNLALAVVCRPSRRKAEASRKVAVSTASRSCPSYFDSSRLGHLTFSDYPSTFLQRSLTTWKRTFDDHDDSHVIYFTKSGGQCLSYNKELRRCHLRKRTMPDSWLRRRTEFGSMLWRAKQERSTNQQQQTARYDDNGSQIVSTLRTWSHRGTNTDSSQAEVSRRPSPATLSAGTERPKESGQGFRDHWWQLSRRSNADRREKNPHAFRSVTRSVRFEQLDRDVVAERLDRSSTIVDERCDVWRRSRSQTDLGASGWQLRTGSSRPNDGFGKGKTRFESGAAAEHHRSYAGFSEADVRGASPNPDAPSTRRTPSSIGRRAWSLVAASFRSHGTRSRSQLSSQNGSKVKSDTDMDVFRRRVEGGVGSISTSASREGVGWRLAPKSRPGPVCSRCQRVDGSKNFSPRRNTADHFTGRENGGLAADVDNRQGFHCRADTAARLLPLPQSQSQPQPQSRPQAQPSFSRSDQIRRAAPRRRLSHLGFFASTKNPVLSFWRQQAEEAQAEADAHGCKASAGYFQDRSALVTASRAAFNLVSATKDDPLASSFDIYKPHPFGVWHHNREGPTSLPHPPRRASSASFSGIPSGPLSPFTRHTRNVHSLGTIPDRLSATVSPPSVGREGCSLEYAQVRASGFPFVMPDSGSEATHTPGTEPASEIGSLRRFNAASDAGSASMSRSFSDQPSMRSYEESSVSARGPAATIHRAAGEHLGTSLRSHFVPSPAKSPSQTNLSAPPHQDISPSTPDHLDASNASSDREAPLSTMATHRDDVEEDAFLDEAEAAALRPFNDSNASSSSSPIMKLSAPSATTPSLRDFPVNAEQNPSFESVYAPVRQRTDSRPTISPSGTSRAITTPAPMPVPQALADHRPTVRRADGQRAESEVVRSRSSSKPFSFPARASAQFTPRERQDVLQGKHSSAKNGDSMIRRFIRRASLKGRKSQSVGSAPSVVGNPGKTSVPLSSEFGLQESADNATPRASTLSTTPMTLTRRRSKSRERNSSKTSKSSSLFAPFLARDPNKREGKYRTKRDDSFGHAGPMPRDDDASPYIRDSLPLSSSSPFLARDPSFGTFTRSIDDDVQSRDFAIVQASPKRPHSDMPDEQGASEVLQSPQLAEADDLEEHDQRPSSQSTDQTDYGVGTSIPMSTGEQASLGHGELSATPGQPSDVAERLSASYDHSQAALPSTGHSKKAQELTRPRPGIPRIWQGLESVDADHTLRSTHIDDADSSDDTPPDHKLPANRFDTATTTSSFKTAVSSLDSPPRTASTRRPRDGSRASRVSLRTLDTPLARHFDQSPRLDSPLSDLITSIERRISTRSISGTTGSGHYLDAVASPSSEALHLEPDHVRHAAAQDHSPPPSLIARNGQHHDDFSDEDDDASLRAVPRETHLPAASHTALVETLNPSNRNSLIEPAASTPRQAAFPGDGGFSRSKRDTFGGLESTPLAQVASSEGSAAAHATRPQFSRFSSATAGPEDDDQHVDRLPGEDSEEREIVLPEVKVSEIESHLAAVEAALQDNRHGGSFDLTSLRQRMSDASYSMHANPSSSSMASRDAILPSTPHFAHKSTDELTLPGAWAEDNASSVTTADDGRRITLAPESHEALADAVRSVRRAISSSQLNAGDDAHAALAGRSVDTLGMESFVSDAAEPAGERTMAADASMLSEATPARAAKRRQEGMRDIEEAYSRMLALVQSSAVGVTPSPQLRGDEGRLGFDPPRRPMKLGQATSGVSELVSISPLAKASTKTDEPLGNPTQSTRDAMEGAGSGPSTRSQARMQPSAENRTSTSLSGLMGMPLDVNPHMLRQGSASTVSSLQDVSRGEFVEGSAFRRRPPSDARSVSSRYSQALSRDHAASSMIESDGFRKRFSTDNTTVGRASSGAGHTSPSATAKTLGTPRSFATSVSQPSLAHMVRRHELEKESLLDTLERVRAENADLHARHESLTSDLHAEVTRVLELERELERRDSREVTLIGQIQDLETELVELRYLDFQLNSSADQTLGSEDGEGSIMDVELPPGLQSRAGIGALPLSPRGMANPALQPSQSLSSALGSAQPKPTHRSTRSEAFVAGLPGSGRSTLPISRSELPRARPVSLLNGPGGLFRDDVGSQRSSQASPLPTPRSSSLLRHPHRASANAAKARAASPTLMSLSMPKGDDEMWNIADEHLPEIDDEIIPPYQQVAATVAPADTIDSQYVNLGHLGESIERDDEEDRYSSGPSTVHHGGTSVAANGVTPQRDESGSMPRSGSQVTVTKSSTASQLPRPSPTPSKIPTSRSVGGIADAPAHRSISSRLPRLGLKPSSRYSTAGTGIRNVSNATDKSTASTLSSVYSTNSAGAPPSLGSLPSGNNTMEDEIQAELARLGNPQPYMRHYSPPRSKMM
ncbi:hypothetical protein PHSY_006995 [Pseudozyma hubeiensis SY62]|uniref:Uncharacterized protein n=1 Tax=Pseudozyma hubeiensis (strain SY62) TaxID=1305764 RepID=R9PDF4_PSEHS|nr:hypothetical protein PHSY_006995 [Pseudozyma hubeiensis SY62]GAC99394.1 hypothetical protein PHSY_006995 [Pseudozyma hubeiensis SY62]